MRQFRIWKHSQMSSNNFRVINTLHMLWMCSKVLDPPLLPRRGPERKCKLQERALQGDGSVRPVANENPGLVEGNQSHKSSRERGQSHNAALAVPPADPLKACITENSLSEMIGHDDSAVLPIDAHEIRFTVFIATNEKSLDDSRNDCTGVCLRDRT
jgi:hypothetical protein